jgi:hypothetical protein
MELSLQRWHLGPRTQDAGRWRKEPGKGRHYPDLSPGWEKKSFQDDPCYCPILCTCVRGKRNFIQKNTVVSAKRMDPKDDAPKPLDLKKLVNIFKNNDNNIKARRANIDAIIDEDFADLEDVFKKLA